MQMLWLIQPMRAQPRTIAVEAALHLFSVLSLSGIAQHSPHTHLISPSTLFLPANFQKLCAFPNSAMEALAAAASGMAVASLSIQLIDSIGKIKTFIRNVKEASKELERLGDLLDRLCTVIEDVRDLMERQASLQGQHFPTPSSAISKCLQSCEKTIQPLCDLVERFKTSAPRTGSSFSKLKGDVKLSFRAKDIAEYETKIEREIGYLHATLGTNSTAIL